MPVGPRYAELAVAIWFGLSILVYIATTAALIGWVERRGEKLELSMRAVPGYAELAYLRWCRAQGRAAVPVLVLRGLALANLALAIWAFLKVIVP